MGGDSLAEKKLLKRDLARLALTRIEESARTENDFIEVGDMWNQLDENWERKQRYYGFLTPTISIDWLVGRNGEFLDIIFDNPEEMHVLIEDYDISKLIDGLKSGRKEVLFLSAIRLYTIQQIALVKRKTDRNILKKRTKMMDKLRKNLHERLHIRIKNGGIITTSQRQFLQADLKTETEKGNAYGF